MKNIYEGNNPLLRVQKMEANGYIESFSEKKPMENPGHIIELLKQAKATTGKMQRMGTDKGSNREIYREGE